MYKYLLSISICLLFIISGCKPVSENPIDVIHTYSVPMDGYKHMKNQHSCFEAFSFMELKAMFESKKSGYILIAGEHCKYCQNAVWILNKAAQDHDISILYVNGDIPISENIETGRTVYEQLCEYMGKATIYDETKQRSDIYMPTFIAIRNGEVMGYHISLVEGVEIENIETELSKEQQKKLYSEYVIVINTLLQGKSNH